MREVVLGVGFGGHARIWPNRIWPKNPNLARSFS